MVLFILPHESAFFLMSIVYKKQTSPNWITKNIIIYLDWSKYNIPLTKRKGYGHEGRVGVSVGIRREGR